MPPTQHLPKLVEFLPDQIRVSYDDGSLEVDSDLGEEDGDHSVDIFIPRREASLANEFIITEEKFRPLAALWGSVREWVASSAELSKAQMGFNFAEARARVIFRDFSTALRRGDVWIDRGSGRDFQLFYRDPRDGTDRIFRLYPPEGAKGAVAESVGSLSLEEDDGIRVSISDAKTLEPMRGKLTRLFIEQSRRNRGLKR